jgi:hypothetical protein
MVLENVVGLLAFQKGYLARRIAARLTSDRLYYVYVALPVLVVSLYVSIYLNSAPSLNLCVRTCFACLAVDTIYVSVLLPLLSPFALSSVPTCALAHPEQALTRAPCVCVARRTSPATSALQAALGCAPRGRAP